MKVWITKYALTSGIKEEEVEQSTSSPQLVSLKDQGSFTVSFHGEGNEWHRTETGAREKARLMLSAKIASVKKQLAKLEKMQF